MSDDGHVISMFIQPDRHFTVRVPVFESMYGAYYYALFYDSTDEDGFHHRAYDEKQADAWKRIAEHLGKAVEIYNKEVRI